MQVLQTILVGLAVSACSRGNPSPRVTVIGDRHKIEVWFQDQCRIPRPGSSMTLVDRSLPPGMDNIQTFVVPRVPEVACAGKLAGLANVRVEIQSGDAGACAVRIGPAEAGAPIDPSFIADWFEDKALGARARDLVRGQIGNAYEVLTMLDGIRIAVRQSTDGRSSYFYLAVDGCGHFEDAQPGASHFF